MTKTDAALALYKMLREDPTFVGTSTNETNDEITVSFTNETAKQNLPLQYEGYKLIFEVLSEFKMFGLNQ